MRNFLIEFMNDLQFEQADADFLLNTYDKILLSSETAQILNEAIKTYENDINCDFDTLLSSADLVAEKLYLHEYTTELLICLCLARHLKDEYILRDISEDIFYNTMLDLRYKMEECKIVKGIIGSFVAYWFEGFFNLKRFALGRLQFELSTLGCEYQSDYINLIEDSKVLAVHIPRTQTPLDPESCNKSFLKAKDFFKEYFTDYTVFTCHSWLLYPENEHLLSKQSNIYKFMNRFEILFSKTDKHYNDLWRIFDTDEKNPSRLPNNTSLRKTYAQHLKNGGKLGWGFGILFI